MPRRRAAYGFRASRRGFLLLRHLASILIEEAVARAVEALGELAARFARAPDRGGSTTPAPAARRRAIARHFASSPARPPIVFDGQRLAQHVGERLRRVGRRRRDVGRGSPPRARDSFSIFCRLASTSSSVPRNASGCVVMHALERVHEAGAQRIGALADDRRRSGSIGCAASGRARAGRVGASARRGVAAPARIRHGWLRRATRARATSASRSACLASSSISSRRL